MEQKIEQRHPELYNHMEKKQKHIIPIIPLHGGGGMFKRSCFKFFGWGGLDGRDGMDEMGKMGRMAWTGWDG